MYVCVCNTVTDSDIRNAVEDGVRNLKQLKRSTGCGSSCGRCEKMTVEVFQQALANQRETLNLLPVLQLA
jgi:bacterioferritin-associated ferredoxin